MTTIDKAREVLGLIDKAILEKGEDYVYTPIIYGGYGCEVEGCECGGEAESACLYLEYTGYNEGEYEANKLVEGQPYVGPACLVGHVLAYDGVPLELLRKSEGSAANEVASRAGYPEEIAAALRDAQRMQDEGNSWGAARKAYVETLTDQGITL